MRTRHRSSNSCPVCISSSSHPAHGLQDHDPDKSLSAAVRRDPGGHVTLSNVASTQNAYQVFKQRVLLPSRPSVLASSRHQEDRRYDGIISFLTFTGARRIVISAVCATLRGRPSYWKRWGARTVEKYHLSCEYSIEAIYWIWSIYVCAVEHLDLKKKKSVSGLEYMRTILTVFHSYFFWCLWFICHGQVDASLCCVCTFVYSFGLAKTACLIFHFSCLNGFKGPELSHTHTYWPVTTSCDWVCPAADCADAPLHFNFRILMLKEACLSCVVPLSKTVKEGKDAY